MGLAMTSLVDESRMPAHLQRQSGELLAGVYGETRGLLKALGRCRIVPWRAEETRTGYRYEGARSADFVTHLVVHTLYKSYRNKAFYGSVPQPLYGTSNEATDAAGAGGGTGIETVSEPVITARIELRLYDPHRNRTFWSAMRDSSVVIPYDQGLFLYNTDRHPGWTHPQLLGRYMAGLLRLQRQSTAAQLMMAAADRWFVSDPGQDARAARWLVASLMAGFYRELDGRLPLEGTVSSVFSGPEEQPQAILSLGSHHGVTRGLRLDVWRPAPAEQKVGQVEILRVDTTSALARVRKLEKSVRRAGEGVAAGDRVVSRKRASPGRRPSP